MRNGKLEVIAFGDRFSAAYKSIADALLQLGELTFQHEKSLPDAGAAVEMVRNSSFDVALMPNPYGNERRLWIYRHLRKLGFPVIVFDRGALPGSWFFDTGFNADSETYHPFHWDLPLDERQAHSVRAYIESVRTELEPLEKQGAALEKEELREQLGLVGKKVLLVPFQRPSDATIRYFSGPVESYEAFCKLVDEVVARVESHFPEWEVIGKKHPLETERPKSRVRFVGDDVNINSLLALADTVLVVNSGVGYLASLWKKPVLHAGETFYAHPDLNRPVKTALDIAYYLERPFQVCAERVERFTFHLRERVYSFGKFKTELVRQADGSYRNVTRHIEFETLRFPAVFKKKSASS